ncbi:APC family permease [Nocardioides sp.]|uniref:APC family permease n=1 Tax=Nocardioides sp. TaxID=35761 RepID=UPI0039E54A90
MPRPTFDWSTVRERSAFHGLDRRAVTGTDLIAHSIAVVCPSASALGVAFGLPFLVGPGAWLSVVIGVGISLLLAAAFSEFASRFTASGSLYTYVAKGLGPAAALVVGGALVLGYLTLVVSCLVVAGRRTSTGVETMTGSAPPTMLLWLVFAGGALACLAILYAGVRWSTRVALATESVVLTLLLVILVTLSIRHGLPGLGALSLEGASWSRILVGAASVMTITMGFESAATLAVEAERPYLTVPRSMRVSVTLTGVLFLLGVLVSSATDGTAHGHWFFPGQEQSVVDGLARLVTAAAELACALGAWVAVSRLLFCFAREGLLPAALGRTVRRTGSPFLAALVCAPFVAVVPLAAWLRGGDPTRISGDLLVSATLMLFVGYALACVAVVPFLGRLGELRGRDVIVAATAVLGVVTMTVIEVREDLLEGSVASMVVLAGVVAAGLGWLVLLRRTSPGTVARIGTHEGPLRADVLLPEEPVAWRPR